jgi:hypothetical protein
MTKPYIPLAFSPKENANLHNSGNIMVTVKMLKTGRSGSEAYSVSSSASLSSAHSLSSACRLRRFSSSRAESRCVSSALT